MLSSRPANGSTVLSERRNRSRLRDLCDEVLASHRAANGRDVISDSDRAEARTMLAQIVPGLAR